MKVLFRVLLFTTLCTLLTTCSHRWIAVPAPGDEFKNCNPFSLNEVQMVFIPSYGDAAMLVASCDRFRRERVSIAMQYFETEWYKTFQRSIAVHTNLRNLMIAFDPDKRFTTGYTEAGELATNAELRGMTHSKGVIWVYAPPWIERICDTSLVHELVHASIWASNGLHGDPDHLGHKFPGWTMKHSKLIQDVNERLCELGI